MELVASFLGGWWALIVACWSENPLASGILTLFIAVMFWGGKREETNGLPRVVALLVTLLIWTVAIPVLGGIMNSVALMIDFVGAIHKLFVSVGSVLYESVKFYYSIYEKSPRLVFCSVVGGLIVIAARLVLAPGKRSAFIVPKIVLSVLLILALAKPFL